MVTDVDTVMFAHAEYLGPAVESEPMVHVRAVEITNLVPIANEREVTRPTTSLTMMTSTTHTTNHSPPQRAFLPPICQPPPSVPQLSSSSLNGMTQIRRTTVVPPAETIQPQTTKSCKHAKIIAGVVGGTVGLVTLGPLAAIGIGLASAYSVAHADRHEKAQLSPQNAMTEVYYNHEN